MSVSVTWASGGEGGEEEEEAEAEEELEEEDEDPIETSNGPAWPTEPQMKGTTKGARLAAPISEVSKGSHRLLFHQTLGSARE